MSSAMHKVQNHNDRRTCAFVLIELIVVVVLIGMIAAVAFPMLLPAIAFGRIEGAARHLAGYGESAMAHAALMKEPIIVKFDLDAQEYWCVRRTAPEDSFDFGIRDQGKGEGEREKGPSDLAGLATAKNLTSEDAAALDKQSRQMQDAFDRLARVALLARAKNARRESGIMEEFGPLFEKEFKLDIHDEEDAEEEIVEPLLNRSTMPEDTRVESVVLGGTTFSRGIVEVEVSPLGLSAPVVIYITDANEEYYTVEWDPITGLTYMYEGKESFT